MAKVVTHQSSQQMQLSFLKWSYWVAEFTFKIPPTRDTNFLKGLLTHLYV